jgi:5-methylthioadenosine/S-adenosylhomocysteine deaminase
VLPIAPINEVLTQHSLVVSEGRILALLPTSDVTQAYTAREHLELGEHALMPGLINAHGHAAMTLLRGIADDQPLEVWLAKHIWPAEARWVSEEFVADGTELAAAEMLKSGTTTFADMYFYPEVAAAVAHRIGMRAQIAFPIVRFANTWSSDTAEALHKGLVLTMTSSRFAPSPTSSTQRSRYTCTRPPKRWPPPGPNTAGPTSSASPSWVCCSPTCKPCT